MIRFCDKMVYNIVEGEMTKRQLMTFFLSNKENINDVIAVYGKDGEFIGIITYDTLLQGGDVTSCICKDRIYVTENFWAEARCYFTKKSKELLTVMGNQGEILGFAYFEDDYRDNSILILLSKLEQYGYLAFQEPKYQRIKMLVITDLNELAWKTYEVFKKIGLSICVMGEKWEWFGYKSGEGYLDYAEFEKLYLYAEGCEFQREELRGRNFRCGDVLQNFEKFRDVIWLIRQKFYNEEHIKLLEKGALFYEIQIPLRREIKHKTPLELESYELEIEDKFWRWRNNRLISDREKEWVQRIYGNKITCVLQNRNLEEIGIKKYENIYFGDICGKKIKNFSKRKIYLIGACIVAGSYAIKDETLFAHIQKLVRDTEYQVIAIAIENSDVEKWQTILKKISISNQDIVLVINDSEFFKENQNTNIRFDMSYIYNNMKRKTWFGDMPIHMNGEGTKALAQAIYEDILKDKLKELKNKKRILIQEGERLNEDGRIQISNYVNKVKRDIDGSVGAIVMNCNPFTYGHLYLIEYAAKKADWLYIFVVEENRSFFSFEDRMEMVKKGVEHLGNVIVIPSGKWILSYETMPIYFEKAKKQEVQIDASLDLEIFAQYIAPSLSIKKRFVGEEPTDNITKQYNEQMQNILEQFDIGLEIIPRKELNGQIISASKVREYMQEQKWENIKQLVPKTTYEKCLLYVDKKG